MARSFWIRSCHDVFLKLKLASQKRRKGIIGFTKDLFNGHKNIKGHGMLERHKKVSPTKHNASWGTADGAEVKG